MSETPSRPVGCRLLPFYPAKRRPFYELTPEGLRYLSVALGFDACSSAFREELPEGVSCVGCSCERKAP